jgi:hypothetical protein
VCRPLFCVRIMSARADIGLDEASVNDIFFLAVFFLFLAPLQGQDMVVGVNVVNPMRASVADQNILLSHSKRPRCG